MKKEALSSTEPDFSVGKNSKLKLHFRTGKDNCIPMSYPYPQSRGSLSSPGVNPHSHSPFFRIQSADQTGACNPNQLPDLGLKYKYSSTLFLPNMMPNIKICHVRKYPVCLLEIQSMEAWCLTDFIFYIVSMYAIVINTIVESSTMQV